jgi:hypothetical protein
MNKLKSTIEGLASQFAGSIIEALRGASIEELLSVTDGGARRARPTTNGAAPDSLRKRGKGGRLGRRSVDEISKMVDSIVDLLAKSPKGLRAEQIRDALGCEAKELPRPLADALHSGRVTRTEARDDLFHRRKRGARGCASRRQRRARRTSTCDTKEAGLVRTNFD